METSLVRDGTRACVTWGCPEEEAGRLGKPPGGDNVLVESWKEAGSSPLAGAGRGKAWPRDHHMQRQGGMEEPWFSGNRVQNEWGIVGDEGRIHQERQPVNAVFGSLAFLGAAEEVMG